MITCSSCQHGNRSHRGYCGQCGVTLQPVCRGCRFVNEALDRFCGGCGSTLGTGVRVAVVAPLVSPAPEALGEMDELFTPVAVTPTESLPSAGITQDDLDKLFGAVA